MTREKTIKIIQIIRNRKFVNKISKDRLNQIEKIAKRVDREYSQDLIKLKD